jgi:hypothetical protein
MGKDREPQIILKTDQRDVILELGLGDKFQAKSSGWDENRTFLEGDVLEVAVRNGRWVLTHAPAKPVSAPPPVQHYFSTEEWRCNGVCDIFTWDGNAVTLRRNWSFGRKSAGAVEVSLDEQADRVGGAPRVLVCSSGQPERAIRYVDAALGAGTAGRGAVGHDGVVELPPRISENWPLTGYFTEMV